MSNSRISRRFRAGRKLRSFCSADIDLQSNSPFSNFRDVPLFIHGVNQRKENRHIFHFLPSRFILYVECIPASSSSSLPPPLMIVNSYCSRFFFFPLSFYLSSTSTILYFPFLAPFLSLSIYLRVYIYIYMCVCVCMCV